MYIENQHLFFQRKSFFPFIPLTDFKKKRKIILTLMKEKFDSSFSKKHLESNESIFTMRFHTQNG